MTTTAMLLAVVFMGCILYISGVNGQEKKISAFNNSLMERLDVSDLQVKVFPDTENETVTLVCSASWSPTRIPVVYIWYKNREFLYEDQSPWYQELVSSEAGVRYSCAIKGYEDLRAPEVSVDSVTSTCFTVTYAKGTMCTYQNKSDVSCSVTYPRELRVERTSDSPVTLSCNNKCHDNQTDFRWYRNRQLDSNSKKKVLHPGSSNESFSCAIKGLVHLPSPEVCTDDRSCFRVNYVRRRICALEHSSVNISIQYSHPYRLQPWTKSWIKNRTHQPVEILKHSSKYQFHDNKNKHTLTITDLWKNNKAQYKFILQHNESLKQPDSPGVTLFVTGLTLKFHPETVTEGEKVTLTCATSCPLPTNTTYMWSLENVTLPQSREKHVVLDPVRREHGGNYSCAVRISSERNISSSKRTLSVQRRVEIHHAAAAAAAAAGAAAALLFTVPLIVFLWIRAKRTAQSPATEADGNTEQLNPSPVYENITSRPAQQDDLNYSTMYFSKRQTDPLYSTVQPHQATPQDHGTYAVVFKAKA